MSKEKNLRWHFDQESGEETGPNDPIHEKFKGDLYYSIVRESIQNSLDAVDNEEKPVRVEYSFFQISRLEGEFPNLFKIEEHIEGGKRYFPENYQAERLFNEMLNYLNGNKTGQKKVNLECLRVSDYNTVGMSYEEDETSRNYTDSQFYAFMSVTGLSNKGNTGAGGSFGFGKGAYFGLSPIRTIIVSTLTDDGDHYFQGKTRLTTHKGPNGEKLTASGYYDEKGGKPVSKPERIPDLFRRSRIGTDINVIGLQDDTERRIVRMVKSVLNNFWLAIFENKLEVKIEDEEINSENLDEMIHAYFTDEIESGSVNDYESWNPLPYYKAVKHSEEEPHITKFTGSLDTLGEVKLYIYQNQGLQNRIAYFRKPKMVVYKKTNNKLHGYSGVFICENKEGNKLLTEMENPAHNEWYRGNYKVEGEPHPDAVKAEQEIRDFVNSCLGELNQKNLGSKQNVLGLEEYLNIPEDLTESDDSENGGLSISTGELSDEESQEETGSETTTKGQSKRVEVAVSKKKNVSSGKESAYDEEGELEMAKGENKSEGGDQPGVGEGKGKNPASEGSEEAQRILPIDYRVIAQSKNSHIEHVLVIYSNESIDEATIKINVGTDTRTRRDDNLVHIISSEKGIPSGPKIQGVKLEKGKNEFSIQFENDLKHSININAYADK